MSFKRLKSEIIQCRLCPRLVKYRERAPMRIHSEHPWRKPVPGFGDENAQLLIVGLAPSLQGANRTGRIFTGDSSARFLIHNLYIAGLANQPSSESPDDSLQLIDCYLTAVVKCVPPKHHPLSIEIHRCSRYFIQELHFLKNLKAVLVLGKIALDAYKQHLKEQNLDVSQVKFRHGAEYEWGGQPTLFVSYHPSPQNTNTGKLTEQHFQRLLHQIIKCL